ncbi:MAG: DUF4139 domain-containing protein [Hyphomonadaceae bacterium]
MRASKLCHLLVHLPSLAGAAAPAVISHGPSEVGVTIYRDPERGSDSIDTDAPNSFALISETRVVDLPPGPVTIRFEGVAGGIVPQSAILFGTQPRERNRDAALLSQGGLVDAFTGQQVLVRRTNPATGVVTEERATIRSAADRMVISTPLGAEAVYCTGLQQTLIYPNAPAALSAKPVLSMTTKDQPGGRATITLAYLANGFDWDATYVATLAQDGKSLALFSWLTMASGDETSFVDATTSAVAGQVNRSDGTSDDTGKMAREQAEYLNVYGRCWPSGTTTSGLRTPQLVAPAPVPMPMMSDYSAMEVVVVTGTRRKEAVQFASMAVTAVGERLGDLVLYKIPIPVTVAAQSQKQVAFLADKKITGEVIYRSRIAPFGSLRGMDRLFRFTNTTRAGLGQPIPAGQVILYQDGAFGRQLIGQSSTENKTINEDVELVFGEVENVTLEPDPDYTGKNYRYVVRNANPFPIRFELEFMTGYDGKFVRLPRGLISKPGKQVWSIVIQPNSQRLIGWGEVETTSQ